MPSVAETITRHRDLLTELALIPLASGPEHDIYSPLTGELVATLKTSAESDVKAAFAAAQSASREWEKTSIAFRSAIIRRFIDLLMKDQADGLDIVQLENGKARQNAHDELLDVILTGNYYSKRAAKYLKPRRRQGAFPLVTTVLEINHPVGVVGFISPWNYPLTLAISDLIPAILAGNAAVLKPDLQTSFSALWAVSKLRVAGVPNDLVQVVIGEGADLGPQLVELSDFIMFTGSTRVGRTVAAAAGARLIGASMELGGKNTLVVGKDVDLAKAIEIAKRGAFANAGQLCIGTERIAVHHDIYDEFVEKFAVAVDQMKIQNTIGWGSDLGVLINQKQLETTSRHIADALSQGARVVAGGKADMAAGPLAFRPTVLVDVPATAEVCNVETFGPVCSIYRWREDSELVDFINNTEYGLSAAIVSTNRKWARQLAQRIKTGAVNINDSFAAAYASIDAPMGGMKSSGVGRRHGKSGILKYTESQTIAEQKWLNLGPQKGMSDETWAKFATKSMKFLRWLR